MALGDSMGIFHSIENQNSHNKNMIIAFYIMCLQNYTGRQNWGTVIIKKFILNILYYNKFIEKSRFFSEYTLFSR